MNTENKRIFISDLPETFTKEELESSFSRHGQVSSVEIKERKELGPKNTSLFFAYVNLITDEKSLNQCFRELSNTKWHGQYVQLQIARENFLERLKRERQENEGKQTNNLVANNVKEHVPSKQTQSKNDFIKNNQVQLKKYKSSSESDTLDSESDDDIKNIQIQKRAGTQPPNAQESIHAKLEPDVEASTVEKLDIIIKCNKNKLVDKGGLKIPSVGNTPIIEISKSKIKQNDSAANLRRLQSLRDMKKGYASQKSLIKNALAYGITKPNNKIVFDNESNNISTENNKNKKNGSKKNALFDDANSGDDSDFEGNFDIKEQFQGEGGQKLLELQSKYKNDTRFALDKRFMEAEAGDGDVMNDEDNFEEERNDQLKILEEVLGKRVTSNKSTSKKDNMTRKTMLKFDPSQPEHANLAIPVSEPERKKKKKENLKGKDMSVSEKPQPEVSKEVYYKVPEKLTETLAAKSEFSLLSMFGRADDNEEEKQEDETEKLIKQNPIMGNQNPFKYDSSDDEDETADIPHKDTRNKAPQIKNVDQKQIRTAQAVFWTEPFFFKNDDFRLQEGLDFIEKIKSQDKEFLKIRRELKGIVKAKVRNNERKNKMFKKKLGGSKRKKHIRMKKALKR